MGDAPQVFEIEKTETTTHPNLKVGNYGPDVNGRPFDLQSKRMGSIPTVSTKKK